MMHFSLGLLGAGLPSLGIHDLISMDVCNKSLSYGPFAWQVDTLPVCQGWRLLWMHRPFVPWWLLAM